MFASIPFFTQNKLASGNFVKHQKDCMIYKGIMAYDQL